MLTPTVLFCAGANSQPAESESVVDAGAKFNVLVMPGKLASTRLPSIRSVCPASIDVPIVLVSVNRSYETEIGAATAVVVMPANAQSTPTTGRHERVG